MRLAGVLARLADQQFDAHVFPELGAEVLHRGVHLDVAARGDEWLGKRQVGDRKIDRVVLTDIHENNAGAFADLVGGVLLVLLGFTGRRERRLPTRLLKVGEEPDDLGRETVPRLGQLARDHAERRRHRRIAVAGTGQL